MEIHEAWAPTPVSAKRPFYTPAQSAVSSFDNMAFDGFARIRSNPALCDCSGAVQRFRLCWNERSCQCRNGCGRREDVEIPLRTDGEACDISADQRPAKRTDARECSVCHDRSSFAARMVRRHNYDGIDLTNITGSGESANLSYRQTDARCYAHENLA